MAEKLFLVLLVSQFSTKLLFSFRYLYQDFEFFSKVILAAGLFVIELLFISAIAGSILQFDLHTITLLSLASLGLQLPLFFILRNANSQRITPDKVSFSFASLGLLLLLLIFYLPPSQIVIGGQDPSLYVAAASSLAEYGDATVPLNAHSIFSEKERHDLFDFKAKNSDYYWPYGGAYVFNNSAPKYQFDFIRGPSYLLALGFIATDAAHIWQQRAFLVNTLYCILAVFCFFLLLQTLLNNSAWSLLGAALLLFCPSEIWFGRANYSEIPAQFLLLFSFFHLVLIEKQKTSKHFSFLIIAIIAAAGSMLMRPDHISMLLVLLILLPFFSGFTELDKRKVFAAQLFLVALFFLVICEYKATGPLYFWRIGRQSIVLKEMTLFVLFSFGFSLLFYLERVTTFAFFLLKRIESFIFSTKALVVYSTAVVALLFWGFIYRPLAEPFQYFGPNAFHNANVRTMNEDIFFRLSILVGFPVLILSFWGMREFFLKEKQRLVIFLLLILVAAYSSELLVSQKNSPMLYWATRRYLPILVPSFIFFGIFQLSRLNVLPRSKVNILLKSALYAGAIFPMLVIGRPLYWLGEMNGALSVAEELQQRLDNKTTVLLADKSQNNENFTLQFLSHFEVIQVKDLTPLSEETKKKFTFIVDKLQQSGLDVAIISNKETTAQDFSIFPTKETGVIVHPYRRLGESMSKFPNSPTTKEYKVFYRLLTRPAA